MNKYFRLRNWCLIFIFSSISNDFEFLFHFKKLIIYVSNIHLKKLHGRNEKSTWFVHLVNFELKLHEFQWFFCQNYACARWVCLYFVEIAIEWEQLKIQPWNWFLYADAFYLMIEQHLLKKFGSFVCAKYIFKRKVIVNVCAVCAVWSDRIWYTPFRCICKHTNFTKCWRTMKTPSIWFPTRVHHNPEFSFVGLVVCVCVCFVSQSILYTVATSQCV